MTLHCLCRRRPRSAVKLSLVASAALLLASCSAGPPASSKSRGGGYTTEPTLKPLLLSVTDLPSGWALNTTRSAASVGSQSCPAFGSISTARVSDTVQFSRFLHGDLPELSEALGWSSNASNAFEQATAEIDRCNHLSLSSGGQKVTITVQPTTLPRVGAQSAAYNLTVEVDSVDIYFEVALAQKGDYLSLLALGDLAPPAPSELEQFQTLALAKLPG